MKVLILSASYGDGHNAAARSVRDAIKELEPTADAEVVDLFEMVHPAMNHWMKKGYQKVVRYAPAVWSVVFKFFDEPKLFRRHVKGMKKLRDGLAALLEKERPDVVVSTYPVYAHLVQQIFAGKNSNVRHPTSREAPSSKLQNESELQNGLLSPTPVGFVSHRGFVRSSEGGEGEDFGERKRKRTFRLITVITDAVSVCSAWYLTESDLFIVADRATAEVLKRAGVAAEKARALGFPVSPVFARERTRSREARRVAARPKVLYMINTGKARTGKALERLLALNHLELTITTGHNEALRTKLTRDLREYGHRVRILGWTNQMPQLLMSHDLLIGKAGGAMVQEAIAGKCPMIINQIIPGQEEGNAKLIESLGVGAVVNGEKDAADLVQEAFAENGRVWQQWRENLEKVSRPDSALRIARLILGSGENSKIEARDLKPVQNSKLERGEPACLLDGKAN